MDTNNSTLLHFWKKHIIMRFYKYLRYTDALIGKFIKYGGGVGKNGQNVKY